MPWGSPNLTKGEAMAAGTQMDGERIWTWLRLAGWGGAVVILLLPVVAMRFTSEVDWTLSDFIVMGALLGGSGLVLELATRRATSLAYRFGVTVAVAACFLLVWVNLAVGFLGDEGNPANLMFLGVIAVAFAGALAARSRPAAMARAMLAAAAAQVLAGAIGFAAGWAAPGGQGVYEVVMGTSLFTGLWLLAAWLFRKAA
jgi:hypothetical protein